MTDPTQDAAWLQMVDAFKQLTEAATGVKAMAIEAGFSEYDASRMGADAFGELVRMAFKGKT